MNEPWRNAGVEPSIKDMLLDPIVGLLMARDRVSERDLWMSLAWSTGEPATTNPNALPADDGEPMKRMTVETAPDG